MKNLSLEQQYKKEISLLKRRIREAKQRGYLFDLGIVPPKPQTITKEDIEKVHSIRGKELYKTTQQIQFDTGEVLEYEEAKQYRKAKRKIKAQPIDYYATGVRGFLEEFDYTTSYIRDPNAKLIAEEIKQTLINIQNEVGSRDLYLALEKASEAGYHLEYELLYDEAKRKNYLREISSYLPDNISNNMNYLSNVINDEDEFNEDYL